jgi:PKD repeat protein
LSVAFTDTSTGAPTGWAWDFGDGTTGTAQSPVHTYVAAGTYTVSLRVTNASGSHTATRPGVVTVGAPLPAVLVGAGDIATCDYTEDSATAALVSATPGTVFALGDNAYPDGTANDYANCYQPTWGAVKDRTRPVVGNHEYLTSSTAAPYFAYYGGAAGEPGKGWYSYDIGTDWHVVVLNSNCTIVGCAAGSPQEQWLRADLAADTRPCTVAMWHHPRFSSGEHGNDSSTDAFWQALYADGAELVLNGHDHDYERFAPQNPSAVADPTYGLREFVVGTGGKDFRSFSSTPDVNSQLRSVAAHGVLKLTLNSGSYDWSFLAVPGTTLDDTGSAACHGAPAGRVGPSDE